MNVSRLRKHAERLLALHHGSVPLVLPNCWDAASARLFEAEGFPAAATGSAGVAFSLGYADHQHIPVGEMMAAIARIARCIEVPLTADVEAGYGNPGETARALLEAGAVGLNLEDFDEELIPIDKQCASIREVRKAGDAFGIHLVINARVDIFINQLGDPETRLERTIERMRAYAEAGADCLFVPFVTAEETIAKLVAATSLPLNIIATAGAPPISRLTALGVRRVSMGSGPMRATMGLARRIAIELRDQGTYEAMMDGAVPYADANKLFICP